MQPSHHVAHLTSQPAVQSGEDNGPGRARSGSRTSPGKTHDAFGSYGGGASGSPFHLGGDSSGDGGGFSFPVAPASPGPDLQGMGSFRSTSQQGSVLVAVALDTVPDELPDVSAHTFL